jgi:hypothetical protein
VIDAGATIRVLDRNYIDLGHADRPWFHGDVFRHG